jgi:hypothetical protein
MTPVVSRIKTALLLGNPFGTAYSYRLTLDSLTSLICMSAQKRQTYTVAWESNFVLAYIDSDHAEAVGCSPNRHRMDNVGHRRSKYQAIFLR